MTSTDWFPDLGFQTLSVLIFLDQFRLFPLLMNWNNWRVELKRLPCRAHVIIEHLITFSTLVYACSVPTAGVGKLFGVEGRMSPQRSCCGPDRSMYIIWLWSKFSSPNVYYINTCIARVGHNIFYFIILFRIVLRSTPPIFSFILIFPNFTKNVPTLLH